MSTWMEAVELITFANILFKKINVVPQPQGSSSILVTKSVTVTAVKSLPVQETSISYWG